MKTPSYAARSGAVPFASFSLQHRAALPGDLLIEVRYSS
jgi:hypothetical protein